MPLREKGVRGGVIMFSDRGQLAASEGRGGTAVFHMSRPPCNVIDIL